MTNFMELNPPSQVNSFPDNEDILRTVWNSRVHYRIYKNPSVVRGVIDK